MAGISTKKIYELGKNQIWDLPKLPQTKQAQKTVTSKTNTKSKLTTTTAKKNTTPKQKTTVSPSQKEGGTTKLTQNATSLTNQMYKNEQKKDSRIDLFKKQAEIINRPDVKYIIEKAPGLKNNFYNNLSNTDPEKAVKVLKDSFEYWEKGKGIIPKKDNDEFAYKFNNLMKKYPEIKPILNNKNASYDDFEVWKAEQLIKSEFGDEKEKKYYVEKIQTAEKYNNLKNEADYDLYVKQGWEKFWGPTLNDAKAGEIPDKRYAVFNLNQREKENYAYLLAKKGEIEAKEYLSFLSDELNLRMQREQYKKDVEFTKEHPVRALLKRIVSSKYSGIQSYGNVLVQNIDENVHPSLYEPNEVTLSKNTLKNSVDTIDEHIKESIKYDWLDTIYDTFVSDVEDKIDNKMYDNIYLRLYPIVNDAGNYMHDYMKNGMEKGDALFAGTLSGVADYGISKVGEIEKIISKDRYSGIFTETYLKNVKDALINSVFMDEESEYYKRYLSNYYNNDMNSYEAKRDAFIKTNFVEPLKEVNIFNSKKESYNNFSKMDLESLKKELDKRAWSMPEDEFEVYIKSIMEQ